MCVGVRHLYGGPSPGPERPWGVAPPAVKKWYDRFTQPNGNQATWSTKNTGVESF